MRKNFARLPRTAAAAVLAAVMIVGPLSFQSSAAELGSFSATGTGFALRVTVDLSGLPDDVKGDLEDAYATLLDEVPAAVAAELPSSFPFVIDQTLAETTSDATEKATNALSVLGKGFADLGSVEAVNVGDSKSSTLQSVSLPPENDVAAVTAVTAKAGAITAEIVKGPRVDADAAFAEITATLTNLAAMLEAVAPELTAAIQTLVDTLNDAVEGVQTELNETVNEVADEIVDTLVGTPLGDTLEEEGVIDVVEDGADLLTSLEIPELPNPLTTTLATIEAIESDTIAEKTSAGLASADATSTIKSVNVLEGFLTADLVNLAAHSEAGGISGSASNAASCSIADIRLGENTGVALDGTSIYVEVGGEPVAIPVVGDLVDTLKSAVDGVLEDAGIEVQLCDESKAEAADDGSSASQVVSGFIVSVAPPVPVDIEALGISAGDTPIRVVIDPTVQTAVAAQPQVGEVQLPRTGAPLVATVMTGLVLAAGALLIRRKVR